MLSLRLAAEYMKLKPDVSIYVYGGGTSAGFKSLQDRKSDICMASRNVEPGEVKKFAEEFNTIGVSHLIAKDALSIYVNVKNPVNELTISQLRDIFSCKTKKWSELGWVDLAINPVNRQENSGTREYFQNHVLEELDFCSNIAVALSFRKLIDFIRNDSLAIGFGGITYVEALKHLNINGVEPTTQNVIEDKYPIIRYLQFYTIDNPRGHIKDFLDWCMSPEAQDLIQEMGFIPIWIK
jgi:phosphate transport system substrate-binding protein